MCYSELYQSDSCIILLSYKYHQSILSTLSLSDQWIKCDDDKLSLVTDEEILKLSGGGDWHVAYTLLYGPKRCEVWEEPAEEAAAKPEEAKME